MEKGDHTFYYGLSGVGMTNLRFFLRGHDPRDLAAARSARGPCTRRRGATAGGPTG